jgi:hypothetical protein
MGKLLSQANLMSNLLEGDASEVVGKQLLSFTPDRDLTTYRTIPAGTLSFFKTFHKQEWTFKAFIHLFEAYPLCRFLQSKSPVSSHVGFDQPSTR